VASDRRGLGPRAHIGSPTLRTPHTSGDPVYFDAPTDVLSTYCSSSGAVVVKRTSTSQYEATYGNLLRTDDYGVRGIWRRDATVTPIAKSLGMESSACLLPS